MQRSCGVFGYQLALRTLSVFPFTRDSNRGVKKFSFQEGSYCQLKTCSWVITTLTSKTPYTSPVRGVASRGGSELSACTKPHGPLNSPASYTLRRKGPNLKP